MPATPQIKPNIVLLYSIEGRAKTNIYSTDKKPIAWRKKEEDERRGHFLLLATFPWLRGAGEIVIDHAHRDLIYSHPICVGRTESNAHQRANVKIADVCCSRPEERRSLVGGRARFPRCKRIEWELFWFLPRLLAAAKHQAAQMYANNEAESLKPPMRAVRDCGSASLIGSIAVQGIAFCVLSGEKTIVRRQQLLSPVLCST